MWLQVGEMASGVAHKSSVPQYSLSISSPAAHLVAKPQSASLRYASGA